MPYRKVAQESTDNDHRHPSGHRPDSAAKGLYKYADGFRQAVVGQKGNKKHNDHDLNKHFSHQGVGPAKSSVNLKNSWADPEEGQQDQDKGHHSH